MSEGWSSAQTNQTLPHASLAGSYLDVEEDPAFRRCPVRADVSQAEAGYGYGYGAYGYHHYRPHYSYSYSYCHYVSRARHHPRVGRLFLLVHLQDDLSQLQGLLADLPEPPHAWAN